VKGGVDGEPAALKGMTDLLQDPKEREDLQEAIKCPKREKSKKMLQQHLSCLRFAVGDVPCGAVEGNKLKHRVTGAAKRHSDESAFVTISPNNHGNARSIRLSHSSVDNKTFPAKFEDGCPHGRDGEDFIRHLVQDGVVMPGVSCCCCFL